MPVRKHDIITIDAGLLHQTSAAYMFDTGELDKNHLPIGIWVPKSMCEFSDGKLQIPEWLALEKGLI